jgi:hypothetical protein
MPMAPRKIPLEERFAKWTKRTETGCWIWTGKVDPQGYGQMKYEGRWRKSATVAYEWKKGLVPKGLEVSHLCLTALCVNPDHLIAETHSENLKRRRPFSRFKGNVCKKGHALPPLEERNKNKSCPICYAEYQANWKAKNKQYEVDYYEANKDRINANRRARRHRQKGVF